MKKILILLAGVISLLLSACSTDEPGKNDVYAVKYEVRDKDGGPLAKPVTIYYVDAAATVCKTESAEFSYAMQGLRRGSRIGISSPGTVPGARVIVSISQNGGMHRSFYDFIDADGKGWSWAYTIGW